MQNTQAFFNPLSWLQVFYADRTCITDKNGAIKPEATISMDLKSQEAFDTVKIYLTGRGAYIN